MGSVCVSNLGKLAHRCKLISVCKLIAQRARGWYYSTIKGKLILVCEQLNYSTSFVLKVSFFSRNIPIHSIG